jgi:hypothetical protein
LGGGAAAGAAAAGAAGDASAESGLGAAAAAAAGFSALDLDFEADLLSLGFSLLADFESGFESDLLFDSDFEDLPLSPFEGFYPQSGIRQIPEITR